MFELALYSITLDMIFKKMKTRKRKTWFFCPVSENNAVSLCWALLISAQYSQMNLKKYKK